MNKIISNFFQKESRKTKGLWLGFIALFAGQTCLGQVSLPHYDGFNYTVGQSLPSQAAGGWVLSAAATTDMLITSGSLTHPLLVAPTGNKVAFEGGGEDAIKTFTTTTSGTIYYSYLMNITGVTGFTGGTFTGFINAGTVAPGSGDVRGCIWVRPSTAGNYNIGFSARSNGAATYGTVDYPIATPVLIVVSYQFVSGSNNDVCKLWINPVPGQVQPAENMAVTMSSDPVNLGGFFIRQNSNASTPKVELDEMRFGLNWADVTPAAPVHWNGSAWTNITGPTSTLEAVIDGDYSTATSGSITAKKLTIDSGSLIVNSGTNITVSNELINNLSAQDVVIENNANLIQNGTANTNEGEITVIRNSSPSFRLDYTFWSSPVTGSQTLSGFSPLTLSNRFYELIASTNSFSSVSSGGTFNLAKGYMIRVPNNWVAYSPTATPLSWTGSFTGQPNNGTISHPVSTDGYGFNAIGNPYPSTLNIDTFISQNSANITGTLWMLRGTNDAAAQNTSAYSTCTTIGCTLVNGHTYANQDYLSPGQGFIVKATSSSVIFNNGMRVASNTNQFFRGANTVSDTGKYWLNLSGLNVGLIGEKLVAYTAEATIGYDYGLDGKSFGDAKTALLSVIENEDYVIQARPSFTISDVVDLRFKTNVSDTYTIALSHFDGLFDAQNVYLKDNFLNTVTNLNESEYSFSASAGIFDNRFQIVYQPVALGLPSNGFTEKTVSVYKNNNDLVVNAASSIIESVKVFDISGRLLFDKSNIKSNEIRFHVNSTNQILLVKVASSNGLSVVKKVIN